jgi:predicted permease
MLNILLIPIFLLFGIILQKVKKLPDALSTYLNQYLIYVVLPALALKYLPFVEMEVKLLLPIASAYISFGLSWLIFGTLGKKLQWSDGLTGCLIITAGLANTSFVGFPIVRALYGEEGVQIALLIDQAGSFIIVSSIAIVVASIYGKGKKRKRDVSKKILTFPPFIFFVLAMLMNLLGIQTPEIIMPPLDWIAISLTPVALTSVGLQVKIKWEAIRMPHLWYGLLYKLVFIPMIILLLFKHLFQLQGLLLQVSVIEAAMAPMITGSIIAISHDLEPELASLLVGVGIPLSFVSLAGWYWILS